MKEPRTVDPRPLQLLVDLAVALMRQSNGGILRLTVHEDAFVALGGRPGERELRVAGPHGWIEIHNAALEGTR